MPAPEPSPQLDVLRRPLRDLRVSVTDRCNLRCSYCMPQEQYQWLERSRILTYEQITRVVRLLVGDGLRRVRLTGGEPLVRRDLPDLVRMLTRLPGLEEVALTTNAVHLAELARPLHQAGLRRINVSLDTLVPERFRELTRRDELGRVLGGIEAARAAGFQPLKVNMVVQRGVNDDEILAMARFCRERDLELRFIEFMDVGTQNAWRLERMVPEQEILARLAREFPLEAPARLHPSDPAERYAYRDGKGFVGVVASVTRPFCGDCSRARLTADGQLVTCLFASAGHDLKHLLDQDAPDGQVRDALRGVWRDRRDRHSEERLDQLRSATGYDPDDHDKIEMIRLGG